MNYENMLNTTNNMRKVRPSNSPGSLVSDTGTEKNDETTMALRKKLAMYDMTFADKTKDHNDEVNSLHEQITKSRCAFEKNELLRQQLEYDLTCAKKQWNDGRREWATEKGQLLETIENLKSELRQKEGEIISVKDLLSDQKNICEEEKGSIKSDMKIVLKENVDLKRENEVIYEEKLAAEHLAMTWQTKYEDAAERVSVLEDQQTQHVETIRKLMMDIDYQNENETELSERNKNLSEKIKSLENNVESERAAHLETKFNAEVLQLKLSEVEKRLSAESERYRKAVEETGFLSEKYRELETSFVKTRQAYAELEANSKIIQSDYQELSAIHQETSKKLEELQKEFVTVKETNHALNKNLEEVKAQYTICEDEKSNTLKELKFLLNNYTLISELAKPDRKERWNFSALIEQTRQVLLGYQNTVSEKESELKEVSLAMEKLKAENKLCKEGQRQKDRAIQETQRSLENDFRSKCATFEARIKQLEEVERLCKEIIDERNEQLFILNQQFSAAISEVEKHRKDFFSTLQSIYELLISGQDQPMHDRFQYSIDEVKDIVLNELKYDIERTKSTNQKLTEVQSELVQTKDELTRHRDELKKLQKLNRRVLAKTEQSLLHSHKSWNREKEEIVQKHSEEFKKLKTQYELTHQNGLSAFEKEKETQTRLSQALKQNKKLKESLGKADQDRVAANVALNVLTVFLWSAYLSRQSLFRFNAVIDNWLTKLLRLKTSLERLVKTLNEEIENTSSDERKLTGVLRFRVVVIVVLAKQRLEKLYQASLVTITCQESTFKFPFKLHTDDLDVGMSSWIVTSHVSDVVFPIALSLRKVSPRDTGELLALIEIFHTKYTEALHQLYAEPVSYDESKKPHLASVLGKGLHKILSKEKFKTKYYLSSKSIVASLQTSLLQFTNRLHDSETDRQRLSTECIRYEEELGQYRRQAEVMRNELQVAIDAKNTLKQELLQKVREFEHQSKLNIDPQQFNNVCKDLDNALVREEKLQTLLHQQKDEIEALSTRIEKHESSCNDKEEKLKSAFMNLKEQEKHCNELQAQFARTQKENHKYRKVVEMNSKELTKWKRESKVLTKHLRNVSTALHQIKNQSNFHGNHLTKFETLLPEMISPDELLAIPELQMCQVAIKEFLDVQRDALLQIHNLRAEKQVLQYKMAALEDDVNTHKQRIKKLKDQISMACQEDQAVTKNFEALSEKHAFVSLS